MTNLDVSYSAAVLASFNASDLVRADEDTGAWANRDGQRLRMKPEARERVFRQHFISLDALRDALEMALPFGETDPLHKALREALRAPASASDLGLEELHWLLQVRRWLPAEFPADERSLRSLFERRTLVTMWREHAEKFVGRNHEVARIHAFISDDTQATQPFYITGMGGAGKSALALKCLLDLFETQTYQPAVRVAYIDFDSPSMIGRSIAPVVDEVLRQIGLWKVEDRSRIDNERGQLRSLVRDVALTPRESASYLGGRAPMYSESSIVDDFSERVDKALPDGEAGKLVLVLDTLEEPQLLSPEFSRGVMRFARRLSELRPDFKLILLSRPGLPLPEWDVGEGASYQREPIAPDIELSELPERDALDLLGLFGMSAALARGAFNRFGGHPLTLRLLGVAYMRRPSLVDEAIRQQGKSHSRSSRNLLAIEAAQALVVGRIIRHIHSPAIQALAHPAFVPRRITKDMVDTVLREHGVRKSPFLRDNQIDRTALEKADADELFDSLRREFTFVTERVEVPPWRPGDVIAVRPELRAAVLRTLLEAYPDYIVLLHAELGAYYRRAAQSAPAAERERLRAEALFHRACAGESFASCAKERTVGVSDHLATAYLDASAPSAGARLTLAMLANRVPQIAEVTRARDIDAATRDAAMTLIAEDKLAAGRAPQALRIIGKYCEPPLSPRLSEVKARAHKELGDFLSGLQDIRLHLVKHAPQERLADRHALAAELCFNAGKLGDAVAHAHEALLVAKKQGNRELALEACVIGRAAERKSGGNSEAFLHAIWSVGWPVGEEKASSSEKSIRWLMLLEGDTSEKVFRACLQHYPWSELNLTRLEQISLNRVADHIRLSSRSSRVKLIERVTRALQERAFDAVTASMFIGVLRHRRREWIGSVSAICDDILKNDPGPHSWWSAITALRHLSHLPFKPGERPSSVVRKADEAGKLREFLDIAVREPSVADRFDRVRKAITRWDEVLGRPA